MAQRIGLHVHGLAAIGFFGMDRAHGQTKRRDQKPEGQWGFHKARILQ
jgi:hypothetical protein